MTCTGVLLTLYTFLIYPIAAKTLGRLKGFRFGLIISAPFFIGITLLGRSDGEPYQFPLLVFCYAMAKAGCGLCFASLGLITNNCVDKEVRGSLNGLSMSFGSLSKAIGPFSGALLFAWSLTNDQSFPLDFHFVFIIVAVMSIASFFIELPQDDNNSAINSSVENDRSVSSEQNTTSLSSVVHSPLAAVAMTSISLDGDGDDKKGAIRPRVGTRNERAGYMVITENDDNDDDDDGGDYGMI
jgi:MFS family permease